MRILASHIGEARILQQVGAADAPAQRLELSLRAGAEHGLLAIRRASASRRRRACSA